MMAPPTYVIGVSLHEGSHQRWPRSWSAPTSTSSTCFHRASDPHTKTFPSLRLDSTSTAFTPRPIGSCSTHRAQAHGPRAPRRLRGARPDERVAALALRRARAHRRSDRTVDRLREGRRAVLAEQRRRQDLRSVVHPRLAPDPRAPRLRRDRRRPGVPRRAWLRTDVRDAGRHRGSAWACCRSSPSRRSERLRAHVRHVRDSCERQGSC